MRIRAFLAAALVLTWWGLAGCAPAERTAQPRQSADAGLPGITAYYHNATSTHYRTVRKPVRDEQDRAMRMIAAHCDEMIAQSASWDSEARLVSLAEAKRPPAREAVADFRASLAGLKAAAKEKDVSMLKQKYAKLMKSYHRLNDTVGPIE
jgi:hypothetical protein